MKTIVTCTYARKGCPDRLQSTCVFSRFANIWVHYSLLLRRSFGSSRNLWGGMRDEPKERLCRRLRTLQQYLKASPNPRSQGGGKELWGRGWIIYSGTNACRRKLIRTGVKKAKMKAEQYCPPSLYVNI